MKLFYCKVEALGKEIDEPGKKGIELIEEVYWIVAPTINDAFAKLEKLIAGQDKTIHLILEQAPMIYIVRSEDQK